MKNWYSKVRSARRGFSLLEVLYTALIMGVLTSVAVPLYSATRCGAETKTCLGNVRALAGAETRYRFDNDTFTANASDLIGCGIAAVPTCPTDGAAYVLKLKGNKKHLTITCGNTHSDTNTMILKVNPP